MTEIIAFLSFILQIHKLRPWVEWNQNPGFLISVSVCFFHDLEPIALLCLHFFMISGYMSSFDLDSVLTWDGIPDSPLTYSCPLNLAFTFDF